MTPAARLAAVIEVLDAVEATPRPADAVISAYFRDRRFIGSKDRQAIAERAYGIMRRHARLTWWLERMDAEPSSRRYALADLILTDGLAADAALALFSGGKYAVAAVYPDDHDTPLNAEAFADLLL